MAPPKPFIRPAAKPNFGDHFDAWNSSSTGHQRAENRLGGSIGWRESRAMKLSHQFKSAGTGGKRISDLVGAGSKDWDEKAKAMIPAAVKARASLSVEDMLVSQGTMQLALDTKTTQGGLNGTEVIVDDAVPPAKRGLFSGLVIYINGSTYPLISDHKLKHLLAENGAKMSLHLGRRTVTHVILGRPAKSGSSGLGAGGGLSGTKMQKEIARVRGCGVKYVDVEWVLESIKAGKRLPEAQFSNLKTAAKSQQSVYGIFKCDTPSL